MEPRELIKGGQLLVYAHEILGGPEKLTRVTYKTIGKWDSPRKEISMGSFPVSSSLSPSETLEIMGKSLKKSLEGSKSRGEDYELVFGNREGCYFYTNTYDPAGGHVSALRTLYAPEKEALLEAMETAETK